MPETAAQTTPACETGAEGVLLALKQVGIDYLFANAGTDFPPVIEAFARLGADAVPQPVTVPHETAGIAMAHGFYLVTGRMQAAMVHVNVGLANAAMGVINAASDNVPLLLMSGRTPITERGHVGSRMTPIQYGQEMYDQASLVSDIVKYHYEMRYPEQGWQLVQRAAALARSEPRAPVYLSLPREPLSEAVPVAFRALDPAPPPATPPYPDPVAIEQAAAWLAGARNPVIVCQRGDTDGRLSRALSAFAERFAVGVVEPFPVRNVMASSDPMLLGYDVRAALADADMVLVLDSGVPWIEAVHRPAPETRIVHIGADPHFRRMPVRGYHADLAITADPAAALDSLSVAMPAPGADLEDRRATIAAHAQRRREDAIETARAGDGSPMSAEWLSHCLSEVMDERAVVFNELGAVADSMALSGPNRFFVAPHSGGLGWAMPAALGAQLADRERLCIACIGDGSYIFANPVACHQIAEALALPILTIIKNNGMWNAVRRSVVNGYPGGAAARANMMPLVSLEPSPDYLQVARGSRAHVEKVEDGAELPAALQRALAVIRDERRQAVLELKVAVSDKH